jgi:hypothetical protein
MPASHHPTLLPDSLTTPSAGRGAKRVLQCRLHLHLAELGDGEVEVLDGGVVLVGVEL